MGPVAAVFLNSGIRLDYDYEHEREFLIHVRHFDSSDLWRGRAPGSLLLARCSLL